MCEGGRDALWGDGCDGCAGCGGAPPCAAAAGLASRQPRARAVPAGAATRGTVRAQRRWSAAGVPSRIARGRLDSAAARALPSAQRCGRLQTSNAHPTAPRDSKMLVRRCAKPDKNGAPRPCVVHL